MEDLIMKIDFGLVKYLEPVMRSIRVRNAGQVPCEFKFSKKPQQSRKFKPWLTVMPNNGRKVVVKPGKEVGHFVYSHSQVLLEFQACVNKADVTQLNAKAGEKACASFDDMLILHLIGGRDHFIALQGQFQK